MCLWGITDSRDQPNFAGSNISLLDMQYKLHVHVMSRPDYYLGFRPTDKGELEGLRLEI